MSDEKLPPGETPDFNWRALIDGIGLAAWVWTVTIIVFAFLYLLMMLKTEGFFTQDFWNIGPEKNTSLSEVVRNLALIFVGIIGLGFGIWRSVIAHKQTKTGQRQAEIANNVLANSNRLTAIAEQGQITDRFNKAVELLGSEHQSVRVGGIYALWRLASDSPDLDRTPVWDILSSFVREPPHYEPTKIIRGDIATILNLFCKSEAVTLRLKLKYRLDLEGAILKNASLPHRNLSRVRLAGANLSETSFMSANLSNANLFGANLTKVRLDKANLSSAHMAYANLSGAQFLGANLSGTILSSANLKGAENLTQQQLDDAWAESTPPPFNLPLGLVWKDNPSPKSE